VTTGSREEGAVVTPLAAWQNFYVIVGSSAGALTGLQFVVMALIADVRITRATAQTSEAFSNPTIVHFGAVLLLSGILSAPWGGVRAPTLLCSVCGAAGFVYAIVVARRLRKQTEYEPVFEDWLFHALLPLAAYAVLVLAAYAGRLYAGETLFGVGAAALLLLFIGIHNAWDTVTYLVFVWKPKQYDGLEQRG
jgi:hypothetical protein